MANEQSIERGGKAAEASKQGTEQAASGGRSEQNAQQRNDEQARRVTTKEKRDSSPTHNVKSEPHWDPSEPPSGAKGNGRRRVRTQARRGGRGVLRRRALPRPKCCALRPHVSTVRSLSCQCSWTVVLNRGCPMTDALHDPLASFIDRLMAQLTKNGYPGRRVAFPIERLYESADKQGLSFNKVLEVLAERGIAHEKTPEKVIFGEAVVQESPSAEGGAFPGFDPSLLAGMSQEQLMAAAQAAMQQMGPDQLAALRGMWRV